MKTLLSQFATTTRLGLLISLAAAGLFPKPAKGVEPTRTVSISGQTSLAGAGGSYAPIFSSDGRHVLFVSQANNLVTNDNLAPHLDIFVRDLASGLTRLVSVNTNGVGGGDANANYPSVSSNGQFVAFASAASNLVPYDTNDACDVFVRDMVTGATTLLSIGRSGAVPTIIYPEKTWPLSGNPKVSADGRWVVFESQSRALTTNCCALSLRVNNLYGRDLIGSQTVLISANASGTDGGSSNSHSASLTPDGRWVAFVSQATNLVSGAGNTAGEIYVRDVEAAITHWASTNVAWLLPQMTNAYACANPVINADGQWVAFLAYRTNTHDARCLFLHDLQNGTSTLVSSNVPAGAWPELSADARFVAYEDGTNVFLWDRQTGSNELISVNAAGTGPGNAAARTPVMTPDGATVVFLSAATDLAPNATNGLWQVYVRDRLTQSTRLVSENLGGAASEASLALTVPAISPDGRLVAFDSPGADLVADDRNEASDVFVRDLAISATELVSKRRLGLAGHTGNRASRAELNAVSADGRYVAFTSPDATLVSGDTNELRDVFMRDLVSGRVTPVSTNGEGEFPSNLTARLPLLSRDGRSIAYAWHTNTTGYPPTPGNLFWRDLVSGELVQVNVKTDGSGDPGAGGMALSPDGRQVAFHASAPAGEFATGLGDTNAATDVFLHYMVGGTNTLLSVSHAGAAAGNGGSSNAVFSPDGRWVVFGSGATDLISTNTTAGVRAYARDLLSQSTILLGPDPDSPGWFYGGRAVFSGNSRFVAILVSNTSPYSSSGSTPWVLVTDLIAETNQVACLYCDATSFSDDGRYLAYMQMASYTPTYRATNIAVKDLRTGYTEFIASYPVVTNFSSWAWRLEAPVMSGDGRFVVMTRTDTPYTKVVTSPLWPGGPRSSEPKFLSDLFVRDRLLGTTLLLTPNPANGGQVNIASSKPILAADGRTLVFQSFAGNLVAGDYNDTRDVFVLHLGGRDTDQDGLDDDWEMASFGTLARDGSGDYDNDGMTDRQEYAAGTDPTNNGSILHLLRLTSPGTSATTVLWSAVPGRTYQVQFKDEVSGATWTDVPGTVTATSTTGSKTDAAAGPDGRRFYRVQLVP